MLACVVVAYIDTGGKDIFMAQAAGMLIAGLGISGVVTLIVWFASRSQLASSLTFSALCCLFALGIGARLLTANTPNERACEARLHDIVEQARQRRSPAAASYFRALADGCDQAAADMRGADAKLFAGLAAAWRRDLPLREQCEQALQAYVDAGGTSARGLATRADLQHRLELISAVDAAAAAVEQATQRCGDNVRQELRQRGLDARMVERFVVGFQRGLDSGRSAEIRAQDRTILDNARGMLTLLDEQWGHWRVAPGSNQIIFESNATASRYNEYVHAVQAAVATQQDRERQITERLDAARPTTTPGPPR